MKKLIIFIAGIGPALTLVGCESPGLVVAPSTEIMNAYAESVTSASSNELKICIVGLRSAGKGLVIDAVFAGDQQMIDKYAFRITRILTSDDVNQFIELINMNGDSLALRREILPFHPPWHHVSFPPPPRWYFESANLSSAFVQALPFSSPSLQTGRFKIRFRPDISSVIERYLNSAATTAAANLKFDTTWKALDIKRVWPESDKDE